MSRKIQRGKPSLALEENRLATLASYRIMDSMPEVAFDRMARLAADFFEVPIASVSFVDDHRKWCKSVIGFETLETARDFAFGSHIIESREPLIVEDASDDPRFEHNPLVTGPPHIKFYAGAPLVAPNGMVLGSLWIADRNVRAQPFGDKLDQLRSMADIIMSELELRKEVEQRKEAQRDAAEARTDLELSLALSSTASWKLNLTNGDIGWGGDYHNIWGEDAEQALVSVEDVFSRIHPEDRAGVQTGIENARLSKNQGFSETFRIVLPSGDIRWISSRGNFLRDHGDDALTGVCYDITESIKQQEQQKLHTRELHHRLRNLSTTIQSIMALTRNSATSIDDYIERITGRLGALNRSQQILLDADFVSGSFGALVSDLCAIYPRLTWRGPDFSLPENAMVSISLVLNELATNAAKYGALSHELGAVKISWVINEEGQTPSLSLTWRERGGPAVLGPPLQKGFGSSLIKQSITRNLRGEISQDWQEAGLVCSINFPLA